MERMDITMNPLIDEIFRTRIVRDRDDNEYPLNSNLDSCEGNFLFDLIASDPKIQKTLEIGCAYGLASLYICSALSDRTSPKHIIIDPFQHGEWHGIGTLNLERSGFKFFELIEAGSEFALPEIARRESGTFDLVFIDGWHTFDHTLLDLFYSNRLVRVGGYIVIDDCNWASIAKAVSYLSQYPAYRIHRQSHPPLTWKRAAKMSVRTLLPPRIARNVMPQNWYDRYYVRALFSSMVAFHKTAEDDRNFDWFQPF
jgi:predicted O-methyltransferase YrrM